MKLIFLALLVVGAALATAAAEPPSLAQVIRGSRWRQRVLLVAAPTAGQPDYQRQQQLLAAAPDQLRERDLLVISALHQQLTPADRRFLQRELKLKLTGFEVVLIGKDGGVKQTSTHPLTPAALFNTIDRMPMRRQEMRRGR